MLIDKACKTNPHIICFVGDLVEDANVFNDRHIKGIIFDFFRALTSVAPVYVVRGDHDLLTMEDKKCKSLNSDAFFKNLNNISNLHVLFNESKETSFPNVSVSGQDIGRNTYQYYYFHKESLESYFYYVSPYIVNMERNLSMDDFNILCIHSPTHSFDREFSNFSLVISGHMHNGGLPNFFNSILPSNFGIIYPSTNLKLFSRYSRGLVKLDIEAHGVICPPINMSAKFSGNCLVKKFYKPGVSYINVKSQK